MKGKVRWQRASGKPRGGTKIGRLPGKRALALAACIALLTSVVMGCWTSSALADPGASAGSKDAAPNISGNEASPANRLSSSFGKMPVSFEENQGQADRRINFISRTPDHTLLIAPDEAIISVRRHNSTSSPASGRPGAYDHSLMKGPLSEQSLDSGEDDSTVATIDMKLVGAVRNPRIEGLDRAQGKVNYFMGQNQAKWRTNIPTYTRVKESGVYPGIDLIYHPADSNPGQLEYDFVVAPGSNPKSIQLSFEGASDVRLDQGDLVLETAAGTVRQKAPTAYQEAGGVRLTVASKYEISGKGRRAVSFHIGNYDHRLPLVIDPVLVYSTFFGSGTIKIRGVAADSKGNTYLAGYGAALPTTKGALNDVATNAGSIVFITELDPNGQMVYTSTLAGSGADYANSIAVDSQGNVYAAGMTQSKDFPVTNGAFQTKLGSPNGNAFVIKLAAGGSHLVYSTFLGGTHNNATPPEATDQGTDGGVAIAVGSSGNAYVAGVAGNVDFPTTPGAFETSTNLTVFSTGFAAELSANGSSLVYSTFLNSRNANGVFEVTGAAVDGSGDLLIAAVVTGGFQTTPGAYQPVQVGTSAAPFGASALVAELNPAGTNLVVSTYLGDVTTASSVASTPDGGIWVGGTVTGSDFPTVNPLNTPPPAILQKSSDGGATFTKADSGLSLLAPASSPAIDPSDPSNVYVVSNNFGELDKSTNAGGTWSKIGNGIPAGALLDSITVDPTSSSVVYVGTGVGSGTDIQMWKSTDGGANFSSLAGSTGVSSISVIDFQSPNTLYALQNQLGTNLPEPGTPVRSTDGGNTWAVISGLPSTIQALTMDPSNPQTLYASTGTGLFKTTNGGATWAVTGLATEQVSCAAVDPQNPSILYAGSDGGSASDSSEGHGNPSKRAGQGTPLTGVVTSTDGGATWAEATSGILPTTFGEGYTNRPTFFISLAIDPIVPSNVIAVTSAGTYKTANAGQSWQPWGGTSISQGSGFALDPKTEGTVYTAANQNLAGFVAKLSADGTTLLFSTLTGASQVDVFSQPASGAQAAVSALAVDGSGNVYATGYTSSSEFPVTANAIQGTLPPTAAANAFLLVFSPQGTLTFGTYLGGDIQDAANAIAVDPAGDAILAGLTLSQTFPLNQAIDAAIKESTWPDAFVSKIATGNSQTSASLVQVTSASITGKELTVQGSGFGTGSIIMVNGVGVATTNSSQAPLTSLVSKKGGKKISPGQTVIINVRNQDGTISNSFSFGRPLE